MLTINVNPIELYNKKTNEFKEYPAHTIQLEHSLLAVQKWEKIHRKPFLEERVKSTEELLSYIKCMSVNKNFTKYTLYGLTEDDFSKIEKYINTSQTASTIKSDDSGPQTKFITHEYIYYQMCELNIPWEASKWHLTNLMALIAIIANERKPKKKKSKAATAAEYAELKRKRRGGKK